MEKDWHYEMKEVGYQKLNKSVKFNSTTLKFKFRVDLMNYIA